MTEEFQYRQYRDGDAAEINRLYADITGNRRSLEQFEWQWLRAPGGAGDIWLIEAIGQGGVSKLVGHHGIMPIRFSRGQENLLFGKTENTMLRPEYRRRILYPRIERRFAENYESRFDALFSTMGPAAAIRLRRAMEYSFPTTWIHHQIPTSWIGEIIFVYRKAVSRLIGHERAATGLIYEEEDCFSKEPYGSPLALRALNDEQARRDSFFDKFWSECRSNYGVTARRDREDLDWRFWSNPYTANITLISDSSPGEPGYIIIRKSIETPHSAVIEDVVPYTPSAKTFNRLFDSARSWMNENKIHWIDLITTDESCLAGGITSGLTKRNLIIHNVLSMIRSRQKNYMPRKITKSGCSKGVDLNNWYITPIVFEGRAD